MHRIRFAFCALVLIGMAAPASAQGPIRNFLRSRRASAEPQNVAPAGPVNPTAIPAPLAGTAGTTATTGVVAGPVATTGSTSTSKYVPAGTDTVTPAGVTVGSAVTVPQYTAMQTNGRRGLFGRRRHAEQMAPAAGPMSVPPPLASPTNLQPTPVPNTTPKPLPTTIGSTATPGSVTPAAATTSMATTQPTDMSQTRSRNRLFAGRFMSRGRMARG